MERESFEDPLTARVMNEHFVCIKVDREERPDLDSIYMDAVVALTGQRRLADDGLPDARRRAVLRRHVLPARAAARAARRSSRCCSASPRPGREQRDEVDRSAAQLAEHIRSAARLAAVGRAARRRRCSTQAQRNLAQGFDARWGGWGRAPKFPPAPGARVPAAPRRGGDDAAHARRDGARRHVRPRRRRLPPLLGRRALARAALREDALRQRAARVGLPARRAPVRRRALPARSPTRRSTTCCASSRSTAAASPRRRTPTPTASRG